MLLVVAATISFSMDPLTTLTPALVGDVFEARESLVGILVGGFGAGSIAAALMTDRPVGEHLRLLPVTCAVFGCGMAGYGLAPGPLVAFGLLAIAGTGFVLSASTTTSLLHLAIEDDHRGRIMALWSVCFLGIRPVAAFIDGARPGDRRTTGGRVDGTTDTGDQRHLGPVRTTRFSPGSRPTAPVAPRRPTSVTETHPSAGRSGR